MDFLSQPTLSDVRQKQKKFVYTSLENVKSLTSSSFNLLNFILHILCRALNLAWQTIINKYGVQDEERQFLFLPTTTSLTFYVYKCRFAQFKDSG